MRQSLPESTDRSSACCKRWRCGRAFGGVKLAQFDRRWLPASARSAWSVVGLVEPADVLDPVAEARAEAMDAASREHDGTIVCPRPSRW